MKAAEAEKIQKYKSLHLEIHQMWGMNCATVPVINWGRWNSNKER